MLTLKSPLPLLVLLSLGLPSIAQIQEDPRALMFHARAKQQRAGGDDPQGAVALYRRVIQLEPGSAEAHLRLSEALVEAGELEGALAPALRATELNPRNAEAWVHLGFIQAQRAKTDTAARRETQRAFREASRLLPSDPEVWFKLAQISQAVGDDETALKAWVSLGRLHPTLTFPDATLEDVAWEQAAGLAASLNHYELRREAIMALCDKPRPSQKHLRLLEGLAREQADKGFLGHAEESFLLLGQHYPAEPAVWENAGRIQMQTGRFEDALASYRQAGTLKPAPRTSYFQGLCLMSLGRLQEAETLWQSLLAHLDATETADVRRNTQFFYAAAVLLQGRPAQALSLIQGWADSETDGDLAALKVQAHIQLRNWKAAQAALENGQKRFPEQALFAAAKSTPPRLLRPKALGSKKARQALMQLDYESMAALWGEFRQWEKSLEMVKRARQSGPVRRIDLLMLQSNALEQVGRSAEAIQVLREAQRLAPDYPLLQNNLGYLLLEHEGDLQEASRLIGAAMAQDPKNGSTVDSWGWVLFKQGKLKEAEDVLRKAVDLTPFSPEIRMHLGEVLLKLNRPDEALEHWERALAYAFPERKELEEKVDKLRTELAKRQNAPPPVDADALEDGEPDEEDVP